MQHTFDTAQPVKIYVELGSGELTATAADVGRATVTLTGPGAEETEVVQDDDQISVIAPRHRTGFLGARDNRVVAEIEVPTGSQLMTRTGSADQRAHGTWTMVRARSGSGSVEADHVTGPATADTGSGDVAFDRADGEVRVKSGSGDVRIGRAGASVVVSTGSGDVAVGELAATAVVKTGSGDVDVTDARADLSVSTGSGDTSITTQHRGSVTARTASGALRVGVPAGTPVWTDISTLSGRIHSDLEPAGQPSGDQEHVEIRATTASGDVLLQQR